VGWKIIQEIPHEARLVRYGLDFGYSNDEAGLVAVYEYNGGLILDEILYAKGQSNKNLADTITNQEEKTLVIGDSSEPKSIADIKSYGVNIVGAVKRKEKIGKHKTYNTWAISKVQEKKISVTERSVNLIKEYRNYVWMTDANGNNINEPEGGFDHLLDAVKYAIVSLEAPISTGVSIRTPNHVGYNKVASINSTPGVVISSPRTMPTIIRHRS
jgi:phage terminase large subunit